MSRFHLGKVVGGVRAGHHVHRTDALVLLHRIADGVGHALTIGAEDGFQCIENASLLKARHLRSRILGLIPKLILESIADRHGRSRLLTGGHGFELAAQTSRLNFRAGRFEEVAAKVDGFLGPVDIAVRLASAAIAGNDFLELLQQRCPHFAIETGFRGCHAADALCGCHGLTQLGLKPVSRRNRILLDKVLQLDPVAQRLDAQMRRHFLQERIVVQKALDLAKRIPLSLCSLAVQEAIARIFQRRAICCPGILFELGVEFVLLPDQLALV